MASWVEFGCVGGFGVVEIPEGNISDGGGLLVVSGEGGVRLKVPSGEFIGGLLVELVMELESAQWWSSSWSWVGIAFMLEFKGGYGVGEFCSLVGWGDLENRSFRLSGKLEIRETEPKKY